MKVSRTVLKTSRRGDLTAEFNYRPAARINPYCVTILRGLEDLQYDSANAPTVGVYPPRTRCK